jgi:predicted metal-dependent enzyme (double-stranded beta helix superfamily)
MSKLSRRTLLATAAGLVAIGGPIVRAESTRTSGSSKFDLERFIDEVKQAQEETDSQRATHEVLARVIAEPRGVLAGLGEPSEVGIHALYRAPNLTILNVIWAPMMVLVPHDHRMWATIGIYTGREDNILWHRDGELVKASSATAISERQVFDLPETAIHSVVNPIPRLTGAIHIYGGDFFGVARSSWDSETLQEHPLDLQATQRSFREANERYKCTQG